MDDALATTQVLDSSGNGYHGTAQQNTIDMSVAGKVGGALTFNGTSDYINTNTTFQTTFRDSFTINLWCKITDGQGDKRCLFGAFDDGDYHEVVLLIEDNGKLLANFYVGMPQLVAEEVTPSFSNGQNDWKMVTMIATKVNATTGNLAIYVNGSLTIQGATSACVFSNYALTLNPYIGAYNELSVGTPYTLYYTNGSLDNVMIFNKALSTDEIAFLYNGGAGTEELYETTIVTHSIVNDSWDWSW
jgi:hypothetical protein